MYDPGDFLVFQLESGFGLMRVLALDEADGGETVWHVSAYRELFPDVGSAESAATGAASVTLEIPHAALTARAFESTQVSVLLNAPLTPEELGPLDDWRSGDQKIVHDRSIKLLLGLR